MLRRLSNSMAAHDQAEVGFLPVIINYRRKSITLALMDDTLMNVLMLPMLVHLTGFNSTVAEPCRRQRIAESGAESPSPPPTPLPSL